MARSPSAPDSPPGALDAAPHTTSASGRPARHARRRTPAALAGLALAATLLAGCSTAPDSSSSGFQDSAGAGASVDEGGQDGSQNAAEPAAEGDTGAAATPSAGAESQTAGDTIPPGSMIARDASLSLQVDDIGAGASRVRAAAAASDGYVVQEELVPGTAEAANDPETGDDVPRGYATIVLSVPTAKLDSTLQQLEGIGTVTSRGTTSQDVTNDYRDTTTRIDTLEVSVDRLQSMLGEATKITDLVALEADLTERQAELDALKAHAQALEGDTSRSSITVDLQLPDPTTQTTEPTAPEADGFVAGLRAGWDAFTAATAVALTMLGTALPFLLTALVLWVAVAATRRMRRRTPAVQPAEPEREKVSAD